MKYLVSDNENTMSCLSGKLSGDGGLFPGAVWLGCLAHGLQTVGTHVKNSSELTLLTGAAADLCALLKGKSMCARRKRLRKALTEAHRKPSSLPTKWGQTRWSSWYSQVVWLADNTRFLRDWLPTETSDAKAYTRLMATLTDSYFDLKAQATFVKESCDQLYKLLDTGMQVVPVPTLRQGKQRKTVNH